MNYRCGFRMDSYEKNNENNIFSVLVVDAASWNIIRWTLVIADVDRIVGHICSYEFEIRL
jgi:hypothetical protein